MSSGFDFDKLALLNIYKIRTFSSKVILFDPLILEHDSHTHHHYYFST